MLPRAMEHAQDFEGGRAPALDNDIRQSRYGPFESLHAPSGMTDIGELAKKFKARTETGTHALGGQRTIACDVTFDGDQVPEGTRHYAQV